MSSLNELNMHDATAKLVMCHLHKFHHSYRGIFVFLLQILAEFFHI